MHLAGPWSCGELGELMLELIAGMDFDRIEINNHDNVIHTQALLKKLSELLLLVGDSLKVSLGNSGE